MIEQNDWRLMDQMGYLFQKELRHLQWRPYREGWDHDHCEFCNASLSEDGGDFHIGYCTSDEYYWICPECFADFKEMFQWTVQQEE
jgi:hypothetical protein